MTKVNYSIDGNKITIEARGHSGYAEAGKDIVCSAISVLLQTVLAYAQENADACSFDMKDGYLLIKAEGSEAIAAGKVALTGLRLIEQEYKEYICVRGCSIQH